MSGAPPWFQVIGRVPATRSCAVSPRLYCFPHGGGAVSAFRPLATHIRPDVEICVASLPGRGPRAAERPEEELGHLVARLTDAVMESASRDFVFFGHSLGALLSFEVARALRRRGSISPAGLVVSGARAPQFMGSGERQRQCHDLPRDELIEHLRSLGGTPREVLELPELMDFLLPALRADFKICETYHYVAEAPLAAPLMVLFGEEDQEVRPHHVCGWQVQTTAECTSRKFSGDHFFLERHWPEIGRLLNGFMDRAWALPADGLEPVPRT